MNKIKKAFMFFVLLTITAVVIFAPQFINSYNENSLLKKTLYWNYKGRENSKITDKQVADFYYNSGLDGVSLDADDYSDAKCTDSLIQLFDIVFDGSEEICEYMKDIVLYGNPSYSKNGILIMIDNHPVVLNYMFASINTDYNTFEFAYEEKTKTLISFSYFSKYFPIDENATFSIEDLHLAAENYYKNHLKLSDEQFIFQDEISKNPITYYGTGFTILPNQKISDDLSERDYTF